MLYLLNDPYSNLLECLVVQLPPVVVSHTQYTTTKWKKSLVTYELISIRQISFQSMCLVITFNVKMFFMLSTHNLKKILISYGLLRITT